MFKDILANDIDRVFLNQFEFADEELIDGKLIKVVIDDEARTHESVSEELERGVGNILLFAKKDEWNEIYGKLPQAYDALMFNNQPCTIARVSERHGMLSISLNYGG